MFTKKIADIQARRAAGEKGFTLVELLVVVVIIAVLAAIAVPIFLNQRAGAEKSANKSSVAAISNGIKTAASTGGTVKLEGTSVVVKDGSGATVTIPIPQGPPAAVVQTAATEAAALANISATEGKVAKWCVSVGETGSVIKMTNTDSAPQEGAAVTACASS